MHIIHLKHFTQTEVCNVPYRFKKSETDLRAGCGKF